MISEAFVYCWTDHKTGMLYVGSHKGTEDDGYVCSSKYMLKEYNERPHDFTRQVIAVGKEKDIRNLERTILLSSKAKNDKAFYNRHNAANDYPNLSGIPKSEETKKKMRKPKSDEHRLKFLGNKNSKGRIKTTEEIEKTRQKNIGKKRSEESIKNLTEAQKKRYLDPKQREVQREAARLGWLKRKSRVNQ